MPDGYALDSESLYWLRRIIRWFRGWNGGGAGGGVGQPQILPTREGKLYELTENLLPGGAADAHPVRWDQSNATYSADTGETVTLQDTQSQMWGIAGEWVRAKGMPSDTGTIWEVIQPGAPWYEMTLGGTLNQGSYATASLTIRSSSRSVTVNDRFLATGDSLANGSRVGVTIDVVNARFVVTEAICPTA